MRPSVFVKKYPDADWGVIPWNKNQTKATHSSLAKLSAKLKLQTEWNFSRWQKERNKQQIIQYKELSKDENLAELIGIVLGDGNLHKHPRTENLRVTCNSNDAGYIKHIGALITKVFCKTPNIRKRNDENAVNVDLYQCKISERMNLPCGSKIRNNVGIPSWVSLNKKYLLKCLKGLFETDGCFHEDKRNYTRCIEFKNNCEQLKKDVYDSLIRLNFSPQLGRNYVRLAKRNEVYKFKETIDFRNYIAP